MRWLIEAADTKTGQDTEITVEALTEAEAEKLARYNGLLVSRISKAGYAPAPVVAYAKPADHDGGATGLETMVLARRARSTGRLGLALWILGWVMVAAGVGLFVYGALRHGWGDWANWRAWLPPAAVPAWAVAAGGAAALAVGSVLRLMAAMAAVLRGAESRGGPIPAPGRPSGFSATSD